MFVQQKGLTSCTDRQAYSIAGPSGEYVWIDELQMTASVIEIKISSNNNKRQSGICQIPVGQVLPNSKEIHLFAHAVVSAYPS